MTKCKRCDGTGTISCEKCYGSGEIGDGFLFSTGEPKVCPRCAGVGEFRCPACIGAGEVVRYADRYDGGQTEIEPEYGLDIFLSYSSVDRQEANEIYEAIRKVGGLVFLSEKDLKPGEDFAEEIRKAISSSRELWLLVSPNSLKSDWVISEWGAAWVLRKRVVPILHRCRPEELPDRIRRLHCIDFYKYPDLIRSRFKKEDSVDVS
jgi:hypothetical protein